MAVKEKVDRDLPSLFEVDFGEAAAFCRQMSEALNKASKIGWQFQEGYREYKRGSPLSLAMPRCFYPDSRVQFRLGWVTAMFDDLNGREVIQMKGKE
jgi:hypothetical protein